MKKTEHFRTNEETLKYYEEMRKAKEHAEEKEKKIKILKKKMRTSKKLSNDLNLRINNTKMLLRNCLKNLMRHFLSNAKLLYSNKTLGDASLNERQKSKIVEAIAKARTPEEAKNLHEALNATVTSGQDKKSPRTLSESVQENQIYLEFFHVENSKLMKVKSIHLLNR